MNYFNELNINKMAPCWEDVGKPVSDISPL